MATWSTTSPATTATTITVNGTSSSLTVGSSFRDAVVTAARNAGFGKFRVKVDGREIDPALAPATIELGMKIEILPFEEAGQN